MSVSTSRLGIVSHDLVLIPEIKSRPLFCEDQHRVTAFTTQQLNLFFFQPLGLPNILLVRMLIDYVKSVTGRIFTMNNAQSAPAPAERSKAIFDQVRFQHVISEKWSTEDAEKVGIYISLLGCHRLMILAPAFNPSQGQWRGGG